MCILPLHARRLGVERWNWNGRCVGWGALAEVTMEVIDIVERTRAAVVTATHRMSISTEEQKDCTVRTIHARSLSEPGGGSSLAQRYQSH